MLTVTQRRAVTIFKESATRVECRLWTVSVVDQSVYLVDAYADGHCMASFTFPCRRLAMVFVRNYVGIPMTV